MATKKFMEKFMRREITNLLCLYASLTSSALPSDECNRRGENYFSHLSHFCGSHTLERNDKHLAAEMQ